VGHGGCLSNRCGARRLVEKTAKISNGRIGLQNDFKKGFFCLWDTMKTQICPQHTSLVDFVAGTLKLHLVLQHTACTKQIISSLVEGGKRRDQNAPAWFSQARSHTSYA
jgi:hypothetical protein